MPVETRSQWGNEATQILLCLHELLRDPAFACALVQLVTTNGQEAERRLSGASATKNCGIAPALERQ